MFFSKEKVIRKRKEVLKEEKELGQIQAKRYLDFLDILLFARVCYVSSVSASCFTTHCLNWLIYKQATNQGCPTYGSYKIFKQCTVSHESTWNYIRCLNEVKLKYHTHAVAKQRWRLLPGRMVVSTATKTTVRLFSHSSNSLNAKSHILCAETD